jgi:putative phosphoesterase
MNASISREGALGKAKVGVVSDTHVPARAREIPPKVFDLFSGADYVVHAGDMVSPSVAQELEAIAPLTAVHGNMDPQDVTAKYPKVNVLEAGGFRIGVTHDSLSPWRMGKMRELARANDFDVLVFGHTHRPYLKEEDGRIYLNPGSPTQPLLAEPSVAVITINDGQLTAEIVQL